MEIIKDADNLKITVKRRTWFLGSFTPVKIQFNGRLIGTVNSFEETEIEYTCTERPADVHISDGQRSQAEGDRVLIKDTLFSRTANILIAV